MLQLELARIEQVLQEGGKVEGNLSSGSTRVVSVTDADGKAIGYGQHGMLSDALLSAERDVMTAPADRPDAWHEYGSGDGSPPQPGLDALMACSGSFEAARNLHRIDLHVDTWEDNPATRLPEKVSYTLDGASFSDALSKAVRLQQNTR